ncbi:hypothetical protein Pan97_35250 [Bremerella volcania]|uniref:Uncharacterized protein n=1 Tax=Bremerella volcania TaxID=2527984 RepID=A0A518CB65_9BACT|nr:hypothetical protein [Bremerella volcania]QDU76475.1 hypothetical protein Pan97_35250 [Bremerella volcania]
MKNFSLVCALALCLTSLLVVDSMAGPRGGGRGGAGPSRGTSRPTPQGNPGLNQGNIRNTSIPSKPASRDLSQRFNSAPRDLSKFSAQDKLSSFLEGKPLDRPTVTGTSQAKLQEFLGLPEDRSQSIADRQDSMSNRKSELQPKAVQAKENFSQRSGEIYNDVSNHLAGQPEPFTAAWYAAHPQAWQYTHPHADAWAAASFAAVTGWVAGVSTTPVSYNYNESVVYVEGEPAATSTEEAQQPAQLNVTPQSNEAWMPLGVYALLQSEKSQPQMLMQLSVSKSGNIAGSYYNIISDNSQPISGSLDKQTQKVAWSVGDSQKVSFETDLNSLTQPETPVVLRYEDGATQQMTLVRLPDNS